MSTDRGSAAAGPTAPADPDRAGTADLDRTAPADLDRTAPADPDRAGTADPDRAGTAIVASDEELGRIRYGADGLVVSIVQEATSREVLMVAYMDAEALRRTLASGRTWFFSRSRQSYWCKGETSGDRQWVRSVAYDCDGDALLVEVDQEGRGACHTGEMTCFHRVLGADGR